MSCGLFHPAACATEAWDGLTAFLFGWFWAIPWGWFIAGLTIGAILGAQFGWLAVISLGASVLVGLVGPRVVSGDDPVFTEKADAAPSPDRPRDRPKRKPLFPNAPWNR